MRAPRALLRLQRPYERFWLAFAVSPAKLAVFRLAFFGVLGLDAVLQVEHAPRYGAGGFNVGQLPWLDAVLPAPSRPVILVVFLLQAYLAFCVALGAGRRLAVWLLAALYGYSYFASQLDSYQHHYLVFLALVIASFVPWESRGGGAGDSGHSRADGRAADATRAADADARTPVAAPAAEPPEATRKTVGNQAAGKIRTRKKKTGKSGSRAAGESRTSGEQAAGKAGTGESGKSGKAPGKRGRAARAGAAPPAGYVASWALRLLIVQVAVVYLWAAVAKLSDALWRDGLVLQAQVRALGDAIQVDAIRDVVLDHGVFASWAVAATELLLVAALLVRRLWPLAVVVGVSFHLGVTLAGFQIGLFSYFMFAFYLLLLPDAWYDAAARRARAAAAGIRGVVARLWLPSAAAPVAIVAAAAAGVVALERLPFAERRIVALGALAGLTAWVVATVRHSDTAAARRERIARASIAHAVACALVPLLVAAGDQGFTYYKYWGGASRRLGDDAGLRAAYTELIRRWPEAYGPAHYHLANAELRAGRLDAALAGFRRAQQLVRDEDYRPFLAEAQIHDQAGRGAEAARAARDALARMAPGSRDYQRAAAIVARWSP